MYATAGEHKGGENDFSQSIIMVLNQVFASRE